ncbi:MAG: tetratricopeptide repeat protein [Caldilineaceae bacterium]
MEQVGFRDDWMGYLAVGLEQARAHGERYSEGQIAIQLGLLSQLASQYDDAVRWLNIAVDCFNQLADRHHLGVAYNFLANVAIQRRDATAAKTLVVQAHAVFEDDDPELAYTAYVEGDIALFERDYDAAERHFRRGLTLRRRQGDSRRIAMALRNLALALQYLQRYAEAIQYSEEAIHRFEALDDVRNRATVRMNLSIVYYEQADYERALVLLAEAEPDYRRCADEQSLAQLYTNRAIYQRSAGQIEASIASGREAVARWEKLGDLGSVVNSLDGLGISLIDAGSYTEAVQVLERAETLLTQLREHPRYSYYCTEIERDLAEARRRGRN